MLAASVGDAVSAIRTANRAITARDRRRTATRHSGARRPSGV